MVTVLLDMFTLLMQTISVLALVCGGFLAFGFAFGEDAPRAGAGAGTNSIDAPAMDRAGDLVY